MSALLNRKKVAMLTGTREGRVKERGFSDLRAAKYEEHDATVASIWFPELRTES